MIAAVKQCWHMRDNGWTERCLVSPATCSVKRVAGELGVREMPECMKTYFIKESQKPNVGERRKDLGPPSYRVSSHSRYLPSEVDPEFLTQK